MSQARLAKDVKALQSRLQRAEDKNDSLRRECEKQKKLSSEYRGRLQDQQAHSARQNDAYAEGRGPRHVWRPRRGAGGHRDQWCHGSGVYTPVVLAVPEVSQLFIEHPLSITAISMKIY